MDPFTTNPDLAVLGQNAGPTTQLGETSTIDFSSSYDSFMGDSFSTLDKTLGTVGKITGAASSLAQIGVAFKSLGLAEEELDIKKDQWAMAKGELKHMQNTRKKLTASYMGGASGNSGKPASALA